MSTTTTTVLTGKALKDRAATLDIKGRSKMSAEELREAIDAAEVASRVPTVDEPTTTETIKDSNTIEEWHFKPNRADRRRHKHARRLRNDGERKNTGRTQLSR